MRGEDKKKLNNLDNPLNPQNAADTFNPGTKKPGKVATPNAVQQKNKAPNIEADMSRNSPAIGTTTQGDASWVPKPLPASAEKMPSAAYIAPMPPT